MTTTRYKDGAGLLGDLMQVELNGSPEDLPETRHLISGVSPASRIEALRCHPQLIETADELAARLKGPRRTADMHLLHDISQAEFRALHISASPSVIRDGKRQAGTRKERRPDISDWIDKQLTRNPDAKSPDLWSRAPDWIVEQIGERRFATRVTQRRKLRKQMTRK